MNAELVATSRHVETERRNTCAAVVSLDAGAALESAAPRHAVAGRASARFASAIDSKCSAATPTYRGPTPTDVGNAFPVGSTAVVYGHTGSCSKQHNTESTVS